MARVLSGAALTAKVIRQELKKVFPGVKFSVTSSIFSGGDSVHIRWTDGPESKLVDRITKKYQSFSGMDYSGDYATFKSVDREELKCEGADYIIPSRDVSDARIAEIVEAMRKTDSYDYFMSAYWNNERTAALNYEGKNPDCWPEEYRDMWEKMEAERMADEKRQEAERQAKYEQEEAEKRAAILRKYDLNESDILDDDNNIVWSKMLAMSVPDISQYCGWGFKKRDVIELISLHEAGVQRDKIEDALDDANWHSEARLLSEGKYAECRKLYGVETPADPIKPSNVIDFTARLAQKKELQKAAKQKADDAEMMERFKREVVPTMTKADIDEMHQAIVSGDHEAYENALARILFKSKMKM
jgi:hypothetical protein